MKDKHVYEGCRSDDFCRARQSRVTSHESRIVERGFTLLEAILVMVVVSVAFFGFGYLSGNLSQEAATADMAVMATKLAREQMDQVMQNKGDSGFASITVGVGTPAVVTSGAFSFTRQVDVYNVNAADMSDAGGSNTGYKKVDLTVNWLGGGAGKSVKLTTLVTNVVPKTMGGVATCP